VQKSQTLDEEYESHKATVIGLGKAFLEGQNLEKEFGAIKEHLLAMINILKEQKFSIKEIKKKLQKDCDGYCSERYIRKVFVLADVEIETDKNGTVPFLDSSLSRRAVGSEKPYAAERNQLLEFNYDIKDEAQANIDEIILDEIHIVAELNDREAGVKKGDKLIVTR